ncbi:MAG: hypothetical protein IJS81_10615 [Selenomonadaceae bacterium]|nr:hypothetical protein [Selenomonadaceae bacterium]
MTNKIFSRLLIFFAVISTFQIVNAQSVEIQPHIYADEVAAADWFLNGNDEIIFAGYGSPLFPNKKSHYLDYNSIKYGDLPDGRFIITCNFHDMYEFAIFYKGTPQDSDRAARFMMRDTVDTNANPLEIDSVLAEFNGQYLDPFPPLGKNLIPQRVAEMLYYIVKGEKFFGNLNPESFIDDSTHQNIVNPYTQDLYDRCKVAGH